jgi:FkbM family methyltransferase
MATQWKATCQSLLKRVGLYERTKGSWLYNAYWRIADRRRAAEYEKELDFFRETLTGFQKNDLIFDIGANEGLKTRIFIALGAQVIAVDPDVSNQKTLTQRFLAYRLRKKPVVIVPKAVSDQNGYATFWVSEPGFDMNTLNPKWVDRLGKDRARFGRTFEFKEKRQVETISLEQMILTYGRPFYIKIDVEGYEVNVLQGLQTAVPYLSFEVNLPDFRSEGEHCIARLREISPHGLFNCAVRGRLLLPEWISHDSFAIFFSEIRESSVDVFWRTQTPKATLPERAARIHQRAESPSEAAHAIVGTHDVG